MKGFKSLLTIFSLFFSIVEVNAKPRVYPGVIISVKPGVSQQAKAVAKSKYVLEKSFNTKKITDSAFLVKKFNFGINANSEEAPSVYTRKNDLCKKAAVKRIIKNSKRKLICEQNWEYLSTATPNDPSYGSLYGLHQANDFDINAPEAWNITTGSGDIVIGVIDTGISYSHVDLAANMLANPGEIAGNGIDDDGNGFIDDVYGYDFVNNDGDPDDDQYHGTHCAGTIGGVGNNSTGVTGVNWNVKLIAAKFLNSAGSGSTAGAIAAVNYMTLRAQALAQQGKRLVATNNSWGGGGYSATLYNSIVAARDAGILFIAAAGNSGTNNDTSAFYPANYGVSNIISVAALDSSGNKAGFSNYGATTVHVGAPGVSILSTYPGNQYTYLSGTSMAAPHVSGMVALLAAHRPTATMDNLRQAIINTTRARASIAGITTTGGQIDLYGGLVYLANLVPDNSAPPAPTATPTVAPTVAPTAAPTQAPEPTAVPTSPPVEPEPDQTPVPTPTPVVVSISGPSAVTPGGSFRITITSPTDSATRIKFKLDGKSCPIGYIHPAANKNRASINYLFKLGRNASKFKNLEVIANSANTNASEDFPIRGGKSDRNWRLYLASACPRL